MIVTTTVSKYVFYSKKPHNNKRIMYYYYYWYRWVLFLRSRQTVLFFILNNATVTLISVSRQNNLKLLAITMHNMYGHTVGMRWFSLVFTCCAAHRCIHNNIKSTPTYVSASQNYDNHPFSGQRQLRVQVDTTGSVTKDFAYQPLRITTYLDSESIDSLPPSTKTFLTTKLIVDAVNYWQQKLQVCVIE